MPPQSIETPTDVGIVIPSIPLTLQQQQQVSTAKSCSSSSPSLASVLLPDHFNVLLEAAVVAVTSATEEASSDEMMASEEISAAAVTASATELAGEKDGAENSSLLSSFSLEQQQQTILLQGQDDDDNSSKVDSNTTNTTSGSRRPRSRSVSFSSDIQIHPTIHRSEMSEDEIRQSWMTRYDVKESKQTIHSTIFLMKSGAGAMLTEEDYFCARGLEKWTTSHDSSDEYHKRVKKSLRIALAMQRVLRRAGKKSPEMIARAYRPYTLSSRKAAYKLALEDQMAAFR